MNVPQPAPRFCSPVCAVRRPTAGDGDHRCGMVPAPPHAGCGCITAATGPWPGRRSPACTRQGGAARRRHRDRARAAQGGFRRPRPGRSGHQVVHRGRGGGVAAWRRSRPMSTLTRWCERLVRLAGRLACSVHGGWADLCQFDGDACLGAPQDAGPCSGAVAARRWHRGDPGGEYCPRLRTWPCWCGCGRRGGRIRKLLGPYQLGHRRLVQAGMAASTRAAAMVRAAVSALGSRSIQALMPAPS